MEDINLTALTTIADLESFCKLCFDKKAEIDKLDSELAELNKSFELLKSRLVDFLVENEKDNYDSAFGKITVRNTFTVATPKTPEQKNDFYSYLKEKDIFEDLISVHSKTLNAFYKAELAVAQEEGKIDFKIPGLEEPFYKQTLSFKRK